MGLFNESAVYSLYAAWKTYAYQNEEALFRTNYSRKHISKGRGGRFPWNYWENDGSDATLSDYYISDMLALIQSVDSESDAAKKLMSALKACIVYYGHTEDKNELTGIAVSLPYGNPEFYRE
ncbi:MAG: hypothetical protein IJU50_03580, partial [Lachnospiraceae bacterium]|nr:hypothetical protein [Lachnospiraceae bacterium]